MSFNKYIYENKSKFWWPSIVWGAKSHFSIFDDISFLEVSPLLNHVSETEIADFDGFEAPAMKQNVQNVISGDRSSLQPNFIRFWRKRILTIFQIFQTLYKSSL